MMVIGIEWIIIIVVFAVVFFGVKKISQFARSSGKAFMEFQKSKIDTNTELERLKDQAKVSYRYRKIGNHSLHNGDRLQYRK